MIFQDGIKIAGFFQDNVYKTPLRTMQEFEDFEDTSKHKISTAFRQEIIDYLKK